MIMQKSLEEIDLIRDSALLVSKTLGLLANEIKEGVTTLMLDKIAEEFIRDNNAIPGFLGLYDFPNTLCTSPNSQVVHGIPNNEPLKNGDIISIDCGVLKNNFYGDHAYTFSVGEVSDEIKRLLKVSKESLYLGIKEFKSGNRVGDVGYAIQNHCEKNGYGVVRELVGHGIGKIMHEKPEMPNYGRKGTGKKFQEGMVVAIEPMINMKSHKIIQPNDGWTITTKDNLPSVHFEHNIAIINGQPEIHSTFKYIYDSLNIFSSEEDEFHNHFS